MKLVVDARVIISALIADVNTRELIGTFEPDLLTPEFVHDKIENDQGLSVEKLDRTRERVAQIIDTTWGTRALEADRGPTETLISRTVREICMSVELPFAPVDAIIRRNAGDLRVSAEAAEELARHVQDRGAALAVTAAKEAAADGRKTLMAHDFDVEDVPDSDDLELPIAPVDRIARLDIDPQYRVSMDARVALASRLEEDADEVAAAAAKLARHAGRRTVKAADVEGYHELAPHF